MKKIVYLLITITCILLAACGNKIANVDTENKEVVTENNERTENNAVTESNIITDNSETVNNEEGFTYSDLRGIEFCFSSGACAWSTYLTIADDGSFTGMYSDSDMGDTGENYPNGTRYISKFTGQFSELTKIDDLTYTTKLLNISYENTPGVMEIEDGVRYIYSEAYGFDQADTLYFYLPGTKRDALSDDCLSWISQAMYDKDYNPVDELNFVCLYNKTGQEAFYSTYMVNNFLNFFYYYEDEEQYYLEELQTLNTQMEMTENSYNRYHLWDLALNEEWKILMNILPNDEKEKLKVEEREWIANKEKAIEEAGAGAEGGSIQPMLKNEKGAELTKERVYELKKLIEKWNTNE